MQNNIYFKMRTFLTLLFCCIFLLPAHAQNRDISIQANEEPPVNTYLHNSSGWGFPTWQNEDSKEIRIKLKEGINRIRLYNDHGPMSHIRKIMLTAE